MENEYNRRHDLLMIKRRLCTNKMKYRLDFLFAQLDNKLESRVLRDELAAARRESDLLRDQHKSLVRNCKNLLGILEHGSCIRSRKNCCTDSTGGIAQH